MPCWSSMRPGCCSAEEALDGRTHAPHNALLVTTRACSAAVHKCGSAGLVHREQQRRLEAPLPGTLVRIPPHLRW